ncbi:SLBB domain-containing protein, partial [Bacteroidia bacterium]|nr:SLBB domain-containing protein [Bacteroidia bacterium]
MVNLDEILENPGSKKNLPLQRGDEMVILDKRTLLDDYKVTVSGPVRLPGSFDYTENLRLSSLLLKAGGFKSTAFKNRAIVLSTDLNTGVKTSKTIDLRDIESDPLSVANILIKPGDEVRVFDLSELVNDFNVYIDGSVKSPGEYAYSDNMSLQNLIDLSG